LTIGYELNKEIKESIDTIGTETRKEFESSEKLPKVKTIVVHPELYQRLVLERAALTMTWADPNKRPKDAPLTPSFADVITNIYNEKNHLAQIISMLVRKYPDIRSKVKETAEELNVYEDVKTIVEIVGKR
jgi:predicted CopG family antitoxin